VRNILRHCSRKDEELQLRSSSSWSSSRAMITLP